jgi:hypothetical protein
MVRTEWMAISSARVKQRFAVKGRGLWFVSSSVQGFENKGFRTLPVGFSDLYWRLDPWGRQRTILGGRAPAAHFSHLGGKI